MNVYSRFFDSNLGSNILVLPKDLITQVYSAGSERADELSGTWYVDFSDLSWFYSFSF